MKIILSGGGTGGHIFPALSIADEIRRRDPKAEILFVGAIGKMEMTVVPKHGYRIEGLPIDGLHRQLTLQNVKRNLGLPCKIVRSSLKANHILRTFKPDLVVGVGGYASAMVGRRAKAHSVPLVVCEQNAHPGLTNKMLAKDATRILLGNGDAERHFVNAGAQKEGIRTVGNPIRQLKSTLSQAEAKERLGFEANKPLVLVVGGSLGARSINAALLGALAGETGDAVNVLWQCGRQYFDALEPQVKATCAKLVPFIDDMATAFAAADLVVSRAGASTISEMIALEKPSILVPSPNVAEDHQTKNARSLVDIGAALLIPDAAASKRLWREAKALASNADQLNVLRANLQQLEKYDSARIIVDEIEKIINGQWLTTSL